MRWPSTSLFARSTTSVCAPASGPPPCDRAVPIASDAAIANVGLPSRRAAQTGREKLAVLIERRAQAIAESRIPRRSRKSLEVVRY
jgi:hypothetical protein